MHHTQMVSSDHLLNVISCSWNKYLLQSLFETQLKWDDFIICFLLAFRRIAHPLMIRKSDWILVHLSALIVHISTSYDIESLYNSFRAICQLDGMVIIGHRCLVLIRPKPAPSPCQRLKSIEIPNMSSRNICPWLCNFVLQLGCLVLHIWYELNCEVPFLANLKSNC